MKRFMTLTVALSFVLANTAMASSKLTLSCKVETVAERTDDISTPSVSFDADQGYKSLSFEVYGSEILVTPTLSMSADGKTCSNIVQDICVKLNGSSFCTTKAEAVLYPTDEYAQLGDRTTIKCKMKGDLSFPCPKK